MEKKKIGYIVSIFILVIVLVFQGQTVQAASMGLSISKSTAYVGDTFTVTISGINGKVNISGNANISLSTSGSQWVDGSLTITGTAKAVGTGKVTITPVDVTTTSAEPEEVTASASRTITIGKKEEPKPTPEEGNKNTDTSNKNNNKPTTKTETPKKETTPITNQEDDFYISMVKLIGVKENGEKEEIALSPAFSSQIYTYNCEIGSDIQKIEVEKEAGQYTNSITVTGLEELKEGENVLTILLAAEDHQAKTYTIKLMKAPKEEEQETSANVIENNQTKEKENKTAMITMPVWAFVLMQIAIIVVEMVLLFLVPWRKILKRRK